MDEKDFPNIPCLPPKYGEVGDVWYCPECARKFHYVMLNLAPDEGEEELAEAWYTNETR